MVPNRQVIRRRDFIKTVSSLVLLFAAPIDSLKEQGKKYAMFIDSSRCYGCMACVVACAAENNVPIGFFRTRSKGL